MRIPIQLLLLFQLLEIVLLVLSLVFAGLISTSVQKGRSFPLLTDIDLLPNSGQNVSYPAGQWQGLPFPKLLLARCPELEAHLFHLNGIRHPPFDVANQSVHSRIECLAQRKGFYDSWTRQIVVQRQ